MSASYWSVPLPRIPWPHSNSQQVSPNVPDEANQENHLRIKAPRRSVIASESTVTLRKNKTFSALVENSYVRLDWVWEVPFAILSAVPKSGMQLMLRAASMEKIMSFYSEWGWEQAWGQTYLSPPEYLQGARCYDDQNALGGAAGCSPMTVLDGLASSWVVEQKGDAKHRPLGESDSPGSWDSANRGEGEEDRSSEEGTLSGRQEMVYAGKAHCAALAKLLQEAQ